MRQPMKQCFRMAALLGSLAMMSHAQTPAPRPPGVVRNFIPLTEQNIRDPKPSDWVIHRGNYQAWGYSPLDQINKTNVKNLQLVWSRSMEAGTNESTPLVYNGVMYIGNPGDTVQAIDAATGDLIWEYRHSSPEVKGFRNGLGALPQAQGAQRIQ